MTDSISKTAAMIMLYDGIRETEVRRMPSVGAGLLAKALGHSKNL
ncbi:hypothetical protein [Pseudomonas sp. TH49]|nr:hypothetical protein [Pseudomonas sp. TH49]